MTDQLIIATRLLIEARRLNNLSVVNHTEATDLHQQIDLFLEHLGADTSPSDRYNDPERRAWREMHEWRLMMLRRR